jgi:pyruvate formate lyase activating enzyme
MAVIMKTAYLYKKLKDLKVRCDLCAHRCVVPDGQNGKCAVRKNTGGSLFSLVYDKVISENIDPIEKKPLFHYLPGSKSLSIATPGCNFNCFFCQNWQISQMPGDYKTIEGKAISPERIVADAVSYNCRSISYTYTEPTVYFELAYDTAKIASSKGIKNVFVTNGFMTQECLQMISPYLDAANVDLKSFSEDFYKNRAGGRLKPVLNNIRAMFNYGIWLEVTTLLIPGLNDSYEELENIAKFLSGISAFLPWHISAYYPQYKSDIGPTQVKSIIKAIEIGKKSGLKYVYGGNIHGSEYENTVCSNCGKEILKRTGYLITEYNIRNGCCTNCGNHIDGIWINDR